MKVCHEHWETAAGHHVCGCPAEHGSWHICPCGELLFVNRPSDAHPARAVACPECLAGVGRPCHTKMLNPMSGVHTARREAFNRSGPDKVTDR